MFALWRARSLHRTFYNGKISFMASVLHFSADISQYISSSCSSVKVDHLSLLPSTFLIVFTGESNTSKRLRFTSFACRDVVGWKVVEKKSCVASEVAVFWLIVNSSLTFSRISTIVRNGPKMITKIPKMKNKLAPDPPSVILKISKMINGMPIITARIATMVLTTTTAGISNISKIIRTIFPTGVTSTESSSNRNSKISRIKSSESIFCLTGDMVGNAVGGGIAIGGENGVTNGAGAAAGDRKGTGVGGAV